MNALLNIPPHTKCSNCGECCGPIPVASTDIAHIRKYLQSHEYPRDVMARNHDSNECIFRDVVMKKCSIYPVRPTICRLFGVARGLDCKNGNSANINGRLFLDLDGFRNDCKIQNVVDWASS